LFSLIQAAGWPVWFLIATSFLAVALIIERALSLQRGRVMPPGLLDEVLAPLQGRPATPETVRKLADGSPLGRVFAAGLRHAADGREVMKEAMEEAGRAVAHDLERYLGALGTIATVAPLLGLFGTVVGMIEIFGASAPSGNAPHTLAHGISIALYNTALGLVVAIPALIAYRGYRSRVDGFIVEMEQQSLRLLDTLAPRRAAPSGRSGEPPGTAASR
jgi:biopolymer transport protein ExbB